MSPELRLGLVGCGRLAELGYVPAARAAAGVRLVAVADPDPLRRTRVASLAGGVPAFAGAQALLSDVHVDGLVLATPVTTHLDDARAAASVGVPVLVEKPPAVDRREAEELAALEPTPWIGFNRRFDSALVALRTAHGGGEVAVRLDFRYRRRGWAAYVVSDDALLDLGPHVVDLARWITRAEVTEVRRASVSPRRAEFELVLGPARARIRCATDRPHVERVEVRDRQGMLLARHRRGGLAAAVRGRLERRSRPHPLVGSLTAQLEAFGRAAHGGAEPTLGGAADGVAVMATIDAVRASAVGGGRAMTVATKG